MVPPTWRGRLRTRLERIADHDGNLVGHLVGRPRGNEHIGLIARTVGRLGFRSGGFGDGEADLPSAWCGRIGTPLAVLAEQCGLGRTRHGCGGALAPLAAPPEVWALRRAWRPRAVRPVERALKRQMPMRSAATEKWPILGGRASDLPDPRILIANLLIIIQFPDQQAAKSRARQDGLDRARECDNDNA